MSRGAADTGSNPRLGWRATRTAALQMVASLLGLPPSERSIGTSQQFLTFGHQIFLSVAEKFQRIGSNFAIARTKFLLKCSFGQFWKNLAI